MKQAGALATSAAGCLGTKRKASERSVWDNHPWAWSQISGAQQSLSGTPKHQGTWSRDASALDPPWTAQGLNPNQDQSHSGPKNQFSCLPKANPVSSLALGENRAQNEKMVSSSAFSLNAKSTPCCPRSWPCQTFLQGAAFPQTRRHSKAEWALP